MIRPSELADVVLVLAIVVTTWRGDLLWAMLLAFLWVGYSLLMMRRRLG